MSLVRPVTNLATLDNNNELQNVTEGTPLPIRQFPYYETYKAYEVTVAANSWYAANETDFLTDLGRAANCVILVTDADVQFKINSTDNDRFVWDISSAGKVMTIGPGELKINKIYFASQLPSGSAPVANIQILAY